MQVSFFETAHYRPPQRPPSGWPVPPIAYDAEAGAAAYRGMLERLALVERLGFDWISVAEHHYSHRRLTPAPLVVAAHLAGHSTRIRIAVLGPIVSHGNPVRTAEEVALLDNLMPGRLVVGLLRGTTGEYLSYGLNPEEARERTTEAMELILRAWTEPQPFGWQGRYFQFRTVAVWPRSRQQPHPPTYVLGTSRESCEFAARHRLGLGLSYAPFPVIARAAQFYRDACAREGWQPAPEQLIYRANILLAESDEKAAAGLARMWDQSPLPLPAAIGEELIRLDSRNVAGEARTANVGGTLPTTFIGCPESVVEQVARCRAEAGVGTLDLFFQTPDTAPAALIEALTMFGEQVLPRIREI
ncbi:MAG TPA: LLM class flavin-dependent oxidoreductase [Stellaceae bacterium]|nr:LLM class flavin-dependent oxidoreductase [Stellaceae bacterium]